MHFNAVVCCRLICQRGQTHTELFYVDAARLMHGLKSGSCRIWQRTDLPPGSNMLRLAYADFGSACKLAGVQIIPPPTLANQILARTFFRLRHASVCVPSRWKVLSGEFRRRPTALAIKFRKSDRVGRRGLFEPREDFSRLNTYAIPWLYLRLYLRLFPQLDSACPRSA